MDELREIEAIKRLKYRYFRRLDSKRWEELAEQAGIPSERMEV